MKRVSLGTKPSGNLSRKRQNIHLQKSRNTSGRANPEGRAVTLSDFRLWAQNKGARFNILESIEFGLKVRPDDDLSVAFFVSPQRLLQDAAADDNDYHC